MWGTAVIVFREIFEIAIIMCVVLAATKEVPNRGKWITYGLLGGTCGAFLFAMLTGSASLLAGDAGKLYFNAGVLMLAVFMIGWTVIWMKKHGKMIVNEMKQLGESVTKGEKPQYALSIIIGLAVMREGSEIVIFVYGLFAAGQVTVLDGFIGSFFGLILGCLFGLGMYYGLLRMSVKYLFQIPSILLTLIAGGMAANAAGKLVHAGLLPALMNSIWDTSAVLPQQSLLGRFLYILIGYQDHPSGIQVLFYILTITTIFLIVQYRTKIGSMLPAQVT